MQTQNNSPTIPTNIYLKNNPIVNPNNLFYSNLFQIGHYFKQNNHTNNNSQHIRSFYQPIFDKDPQYTILKSAMLSNNYNVIYDIINAFLITTITNKAIIYQYNKHKDYLTEKENKLIQDLSSDCTFFDLHIEQIQLSFFGKKNHTKFYDNNNINNFLSNKSHNQDELILHYLDIMYQNKIHSYNINKQNSPSFNIQTKILFRFDSNIHQLAPYILEFHDNKFCDIPSLNLNNQLLSLNDNYNHYSKKFIDIISTNTITHILKTLSEDNKLESPLAHHKKIMYFDLLMKIENTKNIKIPNNVFINHFKNLISIFNNIILPSENTTEQNQNLFFETFFKNIETSKFYQQNFSDKSQFSKQIISIFGNSIKYSPYNMDWHFSHKAYVVPLHAYYTQVNIYNQKILKNLRNNTYPFLQYKSINRDLNNAIHQSTINNQPNTQNPLDTNPISIKSKKNKI